MRVVELRDPPAPDVACQAFLDLPHVALLESVGETSDLARWSFLSADPFLRLEAKGRRLTWLEPGSVREEEGDPFAALEGVLRRFGGSIPGQARGGELPPFRGGALGYFGYDLLHHLERVPAPRYDDLLLPDLDLGFYDWVLAWDRLTGRAWLTSTGLPESGRAGEARAEERLRLVLSRLERAGRGTRRDGETPGAAAEASGSDEPNGQASDVERPPTFPVPEALHLRSTFSRAAYLEAVARCREYILAGDIFQVNLSQRLSLPYAGAPIALYRRLRSVNPAPFAAFLAGRRANVLSASPERFLRLSGDRVETRPIKGTSGRGYTPMHDFALSDDLRASEKDRAENVMIVDLLRNDLSRVAVDGTVRVPELWRVEQHPTVHHLVSTVTARMRPGLGPVDLLRATFPGGSITGAPKVRAMEIIYELEPTRRNVYCGSIGYLGFDGEADLSIAIRTVTLKDGTAYFPVGGAVVADSDPAKEYRETLLKGAGLMRAWSAPADAGVAG
ncbi:MAG TPA: aminodeoxychorismate synthase component I [Gemmatimonadota bacterium]|jgi:para-aminobenzoate synthetase component 1